MKNFDNIYSFVNKAITTGILFALLWLSISLPVVHPACKNVRMEKNTFEYTQAFPEENHEDTSNPFSNSMEENTSSIASVNEEFLHDNHQNSNCFLLLLRTYNCEDADIYIAYHGELHVPPPNIV